MRGGLEGGDRQGEKRCLRGGIEKRCERGIRGCVCISHLVPLSTMARQVVP